MAWPTRVKYIGCQFKGCLEPHRSKGFCRKHYRKLSGEGKRRYQKVKSDPKLHESLKKAVSNYRKTEAYRESKRKSDKTYYLNNKEQILEYRSSLRERERFGVRRQEILDRDGKMCATCHSTEDLIIHHINGKGRGVEVPDNRPENLITLCRSCHMKIHPPKFSL